MVYQYQCNITLQDRATLYPLPLYPPFITGSRVLDSRLDGNVGRCGFPGAKCVLTKDKSNSTCGESCYKMCSVRTQHASQHRGLQVFAVLVFAEGWSSLSTPSICIYYSDIIKGRWNLLFNTYRL